MPQNPTEEQIRKATQLTGGDPDAAAALWSAANAPPAQPVAAVDPLLNPLSQVMTPPGPTKPINTPPLWDRTIAAPLPSPHPGDNVGRQTGTEQPLSAAQQLEQATQGSSPGAQLTASQGGYQDVSRTVSSTGGIPLSKKYYENMAQADVSGEKAIELKTKADQEASLAITDAARKKAFLDDAQAKGINEFLGKQQAYVDHKFDEYKSAAQDAATSKVDPNHYWAEKGTANQITSALAVGLGALGASLTHTPNFALQIIDNAINRDMQAQEMNVQNKFRSAESKRTEYGMAVNRGHDIIDNDAKAYGIKNQAVQSQLQQMLAGTQNKELLAKGAFLMEALKDKQNERLYKAAEASGRSSSSVTQAYVPGSVPGSPGKELPLEARKFYVDAFGGMAPTEKAAETLNNEHAAAYSIKGLVDQALKLRDGFLGSNISSPTAHKLLSSISARLTTEVNVLQKQGAISATDADRALASIGNPADFFTVGGDAVLANLSDTLMGNVYNHAKIVGISPVPAGYGAPRNILGSIGMPGIKQEQK